MCRAQQLPVYLSHVDSRLKEENSRSNSYLDYSTKKPLIDCVERQLISNHTAAMLDKGTLARSVSGSCMLACVTMR